MATRKSLILNAGLFEELNSSSDKLDLAGNSTSDLSEGSNLYYTDARVRSAVSVTTTNPSPATGLGSLTFNSGTGVLTFTQVTDANVRAQLSVASGSGLTYSSSTGELGTSAIPNTQLANSSISFEDARGVTTAVALGGSYEVKEAQNVVELVRNESGSTIAKGTPLAITGFSTGSGRPLVVPADADDANKMPCIGLAAEQIADGSNGAVIATGVSLGYDTSSFTVGDVVYISTTPGQLTTTKPTGESSQIQNIGKVTVAASNGRILVMGPGRSNATGNLNNGNIFIGNASNQAVTSTLNTSIVPESGNLYHTDARSRASISVTDSGGDGSLAYDNSTGVITYTGPSAAEARAHLSVASGSGLTYNSSTGEFGTNAIPNAQLANSSITIGTTGIALGSSATTLAGLTSFTCNAIITNDDGFRVRDNSDNTKQLAFELSGVSTGTTRTLTVPDVNGTIADEGFATAIAVALG